MRPLLPAPSERPCVRGPARGPSLCVERAKRTARGGLLGSGGGQSRGPRAATRPAMGVSHARPGLCRLPPHHRGAAPGWTVCQRWGAGPCSPVRGNNVMPLRVGGCRLLARWSDPLPGDSPLPQPLCDSDFSREGYLLPLFLADKPFRGGGTISFFEAHPARTPSNPSVAACVGCVLWGRHRRGRVEHTPAPAADAKERSSAAAAAVAAIIRERFEGDEAAVDGGGEAFPLAPCQKAGGEAATRPHTAQRVAFESTRATISAAPPASSGGKR